MKPSLRHPWRFVILAGCMGPALWAGMRGFAASCSFVPSGPEMDDVVDPEPEILVSFVLTSLSVAWLLRTSIVRASVWRAAWLSWLSSVLGGAVYLLILLAIVVATGRGGEAGLGDIVFGVLGGMLLGPVYSFFFWPVTLPLGWVSILLLRRASGGLAEEAHATQ